MGGAGQIGYGPLEQVDGPLPVPPVYGLLQAAAAPAAGVRIVPDADAEGRERWINGVQLYPYPPDVPEAWDACALGSDRHAKGSGAGLVLPEFGAFTLWLAETCTTYQVPDQAAFKARAITAFTASESAGVAREFLSGSILKLNPHLSDGQGSFPNGDGVTSPVNGLALLEGEIAKSGRLGLIHMSPITATLLRNNYVVDNKTGVLRTINGNVVIPDAGYVYGATPAPRPPAFPAGHPDPSNGQEWIYATGAIDVRRSEIFTVPDNVTEAVDRGLGGMPNSVTYRAERFYLVDWDTTVQAAVLIDRCRDNC